MTKAKYLKKLRCYLSIYFNRAERGEIISDYEELFFGEYEGDTGAGSVADTMDSPRMLARRMAKEEEKADIISILKNRMRGESMAYILLLLISAHMLAFCINNNYDYIFFASVATVCYGCYICLQSRKNRFQGRVGVVPCTVYVVISIIFEMLVLFLFLKVRNLSVWQTYDSFLKLGCSFIPFIGCCFMIIKMDTLTGIILSLWFFSTTQVFFVTHNHHGLDLAITREEWIVFFLIKSMTLYLITGVITFITIRQQALFKTDGRTA